MNKSYSLQETFAPNSSYRVFLACVLITGLSSGLYKGILDNYLAEIVRMSEMDRGGHRILPGDDRDPACIHSCSMLYV